MNLIKEIVQWHKELISWRRDIHAHPELAFAEVRTANFIAAKLNSFGLEVTSGIGGTGVVGTLRAGSSNRSIGLRADMDALPMEELNTFGYQSKFPGRMHGCGHDGHTVMLLGAALYLANKKDFNGTVQFIFQPAEEANSIGSGAKAMIDDGLFQKFPVDNIFALHNGPGLRAGAIATRPGAIMGSMDLFEVSITGRGTHGAVPHSGVDPIVIMATLISAWQTIVSRNIDPTESAVLSVASLNAGNSWNVIPQQAVARGSIRSLSNRVQKQIKSKFYAITESIANGLGASVEITYDQSSPVTFNDENATAVACDVAASIVGEDQVIRCAPAVLGSDDFSHMLEHVSGCYLWIGNSDPCSDDEESNLKTTNSGLGLLGVQDACMVHEPHYDFNDKIIPTGATFLARLAESHLM